MSGIKIITPITAPLDDKGQHDCPGLLGFTVPSTNVCSNMSLFTFRIYRLRAGTGQSSSTSDRQGRKRVTAPGTVHTYFTLAVPLRTASLEAFTGTAAILAGFFRLSTNSCQKIKIGLAMKIEEYVPTMIPTTSANANPFNT